MRRSFENVFLLPFPRRNVKITVSLYDSKGKTVGTMTHPVKVDDILIRPVASPAGRGVLFIAARPMNRASIW